MESADSISEKFDKIIKMCLGFEDCVNNEDKYFLECLTLCEELVKDIQKHNLFSANEEIEDIDPKHLKYLLIPYYQADTLFRLMDDRKKRIQSSKNFYNEFLRLMSHYSLVDPSAKKAWKHSINPEESRAEPKLSANDEREQRIEEFKKKKLIEQTIDKLKDSEDDSDIKQFWMNMIHLAIMKSISAFKSIDLEFQLLVYRDSLPADQRGPAQPPKEKKQIEMFHIPKGALDGGSYMFGNGEVSQLPNQNTGESIVQTFQDTGERVTVNTLTNDINKRTNLKEQMKAQVFQPHWDQPTMSLEEFGEMEYQDMKAREAQDHQRQMLEEAKDAETVEEEERQKLIRNDNMKDEIPKGYGNTKRL